MLINLCPHQRILRKNDRPDKNVGIRKCFIAIVLPNLVPDFLIGIDCEFQTFPTL